MRLTSGRKEISSGEIRDERFSVGVSGKTLLETEGSKVKVVEVTESFLVGSLLV